MKIKLSVAGIATLTLWLLGFLDQHIATRDLVCVSIGIWSATIGLHITEKLLNRSK